MSREKTEDEKQKRLRSDSVKAEIEAMRYANGTIDVPENITLTESEEQHWHLIISSRAITSWTNNDLMMAGMLARCYADIEKYSVMLSKSRILKDSSNQLKINPVHKIMEDLHKQALSLSRTLQIHPRATQGEARDQVDRNKLYKKSSDAFNNIDELIAQPENRVN